jgi:hypothetical protein
MTRCALLIAVALTASGCLVSSMQPIYDGETIVFDEALLGRWENREAEVSVEIARGQWRSYHIVYTDRFGTARFTGHATHIGPGRFLNLRPEDGLERPAFLVATNGILQIDATPSGLRVREPDYATLLERITAGTAGTPAAVDVKNNVVLTGPPARVRSWIETSLKDDSLWAEWKTFTRSAR